MKLLIQHAETKYKFSTLLNSELQTSSLYTVLKNCYTNKSDILNNILVNGVALLKFFEFSFFDLNPI